ncbi:MAG: S-adenosylmethionine:tRNA ribosyltransferase-isomerase, partial [Desulfobulbaceae bacterium]|nr:S-adenosylmethionine:tRNA ribosyltransferase-isomerase [Desulfobulbaceae bacterium]
MSLHPDDFLLASYRYHLPPEQIAQYPAAKRDQARLLMLNADSGKTRHGHFADVLNFIDKNDVLVLNDTRVFPARLFGRKDSGGKAEVFLLEFPRQIGPGEAVVTALVKSSKRPKAGGAIVIGDSLRCLVAEDLGDGKMRLRLLFPAARGLARRVGRFGAKPR